MFMDCTPFKLLWQTKSGLNTLFMPHQTLSAVWKKKATTINVKVKDVTPKRLDEMLGKDAVHQGAALHCKPIERQSFNGLEDAKLLLILDQVTDPHNVGAILRSACAFGADAVVTPARFTPQESGVLAKSALVLLIGRQ